MFDWTYDLFIEDAARFVATPVGVYDNGRNPRRAFMRWFKTFAQNFAVQWAAEHEHQYDPYDGWIGDSFAEELRESLFSDLYKDAYGQRPHLPLWYYVQATGFPHSEDVGRTFCAKPVQEAAQAAQAYRDRW